MTADLAARDLLEVALGAGRDNAESTGSLAERLKMTPREVQQAIQDLRLYGKAIASGSDGVWIGDAQDMAATAQILRGRLISQYRTLRAVRGTTARLRAYQVHQLPLFDAA